jgi:hypothetical protein
VEINDSAVINCSPEWCVGTRGSVIDSALCYKPEGRRFESRMRWIFSIFLILPNALWP